MNIVLEKITDNCSMDCKHCPYAKLNNSYNDKVTFNAEPKSIYILTGGEPFEALNDLKKKF